MIILAIDTATPATVVALDLGDGSPPRQARDDPPAGARPGHCTTLLALVDNLLEEETLGWDAVNRVVVGVGPGTFTGLRIGLATARGLAQSLSAEIVGVSTLEVLARAALREPGESSILAAIDARRGEIFLAGFHRSGAPLLAPRATAPEDLAPILASRRWLAVGDGAIRFREDLQRLDVAVPEPDSALHRIDGRTLCELGRAPEAVPLEDVLPAYLRAPDAELALAGSPR